MSWIAELERLQKKHQELQKQYGQVCENIKALTCDYHRENREYERLQLKRRLEDQMYEQEELEERMRFLESQMERNPAHMFFEKLLTFDYMKHLQCFDDFVAQNTSGIFILHGETQAGLQLLLKRLLHYLPLTRGLSVPIRLNLRAIQKFNSCGCSSQRIPRFSSKILWQQLGKCLQCDPQPEEVASKILHTCQLQNVILIFDDVDWTIDVQAIIEEFWQRLLSLIQTDFSESHRALVVLLLVYDQEFLNESQVSFQEFYQESWTPQIPVKLPVVGRYGFEDIEDWILDFCKRNPHRWSKSHHEIIQDIFTLSDNGHPERVLECLCTQFCQCAFNEGVLQEWLQKI